MSTEDSPGRRDGRRERDKTTAALGSDHNPVPPSSQKPSKMSKRDLISVKENQARLRKCVGHHFTLQGSMGAVSKYECTVCGGIARGDQVFWYMQGAKAAGARVLEGDNSIWFRKP